MATWPIPAGESPIASTNINDLDQRISNTVESIDTDTVATAEATSSTTYTDLATTGPTVTVTCPSSKALVVIAGELQNATDAAATFMSFEVSGASTIAADDSRALRCDIGANDRLRFGITTPVDTLSTGSNTFTCKYRVEGGSTGTYRDRSIAVFPLGG